MKDRRSRLRALFPEAFVADQLDADALLRVLGQPAKTDRERYGLSWPGKQASLALAQCPGTATLTPVPEESIGPEDSEHLLIEGDNLEALKCLRATHANSIKLIYIDPPYNTGSDFIYADNYADSVHRYLAYTGQADDPGTDDTEIMGRFHARWLSMMAPRLRLARELLRQDGVIVISIDDNEMAALRLLCDEIFGPNHFLNCVAVKMSEASGLKMTHVTARLPKLKEYLLIYRKSEQALLNPVCVPPEKWNEEYRYFVDGVSRQALDHIKHLIERKHVPAELLSMVDALLAPAVLLSADEAYRKHGEGEDFETWRWQNAWRFIQAVGSGSVKKLALAEKRDAAQPIRALRSSTGRLYLYRTDFNSLARSPRVQVLFADLNSAVKLGDFWADIRTTGAVGQEGGIRFPNGKKPQRLLRRLLHLFTSAQADDWVLDFFAGSGSTGQAVLDQNQEDGGTRRFILVQWPEPIDPQESLHAEGFRTISAVTAARLKYVINANQSGGFRLFRLTPRLSKD